MPTSSLAAIPSFTSPTARSRPASAPVSIIRKLEYSREGGSEKHLRDIASILRVSSDLVRFELVDDWTERLGLTQEWKRARALV